MRVTGLLMFDSEHFLGRPLERVNDWEIHPVLKLEFCEIGNDCAGYRQLNSTRNKISDVGDRKGRFVIWLINVRLDANGLIP